MSIYNAAKLAVMVLPSLSVTDVAIPLRHFDWPKLAFIGGWLGTCMVVAFLLPAWEAAKCGGKREKCLF
jgi:hypothetical protein